MKSYAGVRVTLLNRDDGTERVMMLYPATRVELVELPLAAGAPEKVRTFVPLDNMTADVMGWKELA